MAAVSSEKVWEVLAPIFGLKDAGAKAFELRLETGKPAEITVTHLVTIEGFDITKDIKTRFRLVSAEAE